MLAVPMAICNTRLGLVVATCAVTAVLLAPLPASAQEPEPDVADSDGSVASADVAQTEGESRGFWHRAGAGLNHIWSSGGSDVYVPGYIWHLPYKYSDEQIQRKEGKTVQ